MRKQKFEGDRRVPSALETAKLIWEAIDTPVSLSCYLLCKYKEFDQLCRKQVRPESYTRSIDFAYDYQAVKLVQKLDELPTDKTTRKSNAMRTFIDAEHSCRKTNDFFFALWSRELDLLPRDAIAISVMRRKISAVLGPCPSLSDLDCRFGPGASLSVRKETSVYNKMTSPLECTLAFTRLLPEFRKEFPAYADEHSHLNIVRGSELAFVPKDCKTDRSICIEPLLNGFVQKGVGSYMKQRLLARGINLFDQSINQGLARVGVTRDLATVDFSSASDTISHGVVCHLLEPEWYELLHTLRSPAYLVEGLWWPFSKFTSMGNAYTFELESLIFYAAAAAACEEVGVPYTVGENLHVYGDDVILPCSAYDAFLRICRVLGFTINQEKSFHQGLFRESCGCDYFDGNDVRPFMLKKGIRRDSDVYYVANMILLMVGKGLTRLDRVHTMLVSRTPRRSRYLIPSGMGHSGFHAPFDVSVPRRHECYDGWIVTGVQEVAVSKPLPSEPPMSYALYYAGSSSWDGLPNIDCKDLMGVSDSYTVRNRTKTKRCKTFWFGSWGSCTPWPPASLRLIARHLTP